MRHWRWCQRWWSGSRPTWCGLRAPRRGRARQRGQQRRAPRPLHRPWSRHRRQPSHRLQGHGASGARGRRTHRCDARRRSGRWLALAKCSSGTGRPRGGWLHVQPTIPQHRLHHRQPAGNNRAGTRSAATSSNAGHGRSDAGHELTPVRSRCRCGPAAALALAQPQIHCCCGKRTTGKRSGLQRPHFRQCDAPGCQCDDCWLRRCCLLPWLHALSYPSCCCCCWAVSWPHLVLALSVVSLPM